MALTEKTKKIIKTILLIYSAILLIILSLYLIQIYYFEKLDRFDGYRIWEPNYLDRSLRMDRGDYFHPDETYEDERRKGIKVTYIRNNDSSVNFIGKDMSLIDEYIDDAVDNKEFILVDQKPLDSIFGKIEEQYINDKIDHVGRKIFPMKELINESNIHQYWIIRKKLDYVYGPFRKEEYILKKKELGVPDNLKLKFEK